MLKVDAEWVEIKFEKSHLKCKPNHWFEKTTPLIMIEISWTDFC